MRVVGVDELADLLESRSALGGILRERHVVEGDAVSLRDRFEIAMVADDRADLGVEFPCGDPSEDVVQAVPFLADEQHDALALAGVGERPFGLRADVGGDARELLAQLVESERDRRRPDGLPGEEPTGVLIGVVGRLDDRTTDLREEGRDAGDDPGGVRAAQGQNVTSIVGG